MVGGLVTSTRFTLLALPTFYLFVHDLSERWGLAQSCGLGDGRVEAVTVPGAKLLHGSRGDRGAGRWAIFVLMTFELWVSHGPGH